MNNQLSDKSFKHAIFDGIKEEFDDGYSFIHQNKIYQHNSTYESLVCIHEGKFICEISMDDEYLILFYVDDSGIIVKKFQLVSPDCIDAMCSTIKTIDNSD